MSADTVSLATAEHTGASKSNLVRNTLRNPFGAIGAVLLTSSSSPRSLRR